MRREYWTPHSPIEKHSVHSNVTGTWFSVVNEYCMSCMTVTSRTVRSMLALVPRVTMEQENVFLDDTGWEVEVNPDEVYTIQTPAKKKRTRLLKKKRGKPYWMDMLGDLASESSNIATAINNVASLAGLLAIAVNFWPLHWLACACLRWCVMSMQWADNKLCQNAYDLITCLSCYFAQIVSMGLCGVQYSLLIINS